MNEQAPRTSTRQFCGRCNNVYAVDFMVPKPIWRRVAGPRWENEKLCLSCFAAIGDEKFIEWEVGIEFFPTSYASHHRRRVEGMWAGFEGGRQ